MHGTEPSNSSNSWDKATNDHFENHANPDPHQPTDQGVALMGIRTIGRPQPCPACGADASHSSANHHPDVFIGLLDLPLNPDIPDGERWHLAVYASVAL